MLVVIGIIAFLASISLAVYTNIAQTGREKATAATIRKIQGLLAERMDAYERSLKADTMRRLTDRKLAELQAAGIFGVSPKAAEILVRKDLFRANFPQRYSELATPLASPAPPADEYESSEMLYHMLTNMTVFGVAPVGDDAFSTSEVADGNNNGMREFIDAWGNPLRFYRWPTRLIRPAAAAPFTTAGPVRPTTLADELIKGLPAPAGSGQRDPLSVDPDDPLGLIKREITRLSAFSGVFNEAAHEAQVHTVDTYHIPLIVSAGADGELGLFEPIDATNFGNLAQPDTGLSGLQSILSDNVTNRKEMAGGGN
jgi:hypothetical protein